jgi:predicted phosphodiesterase
MGYPKPTRAAYEALKQYATANELKWLNACQKHDGPRPAAKALGLTAAQGFSALRTVRKRAARRGWAPEHGWNPPLERTEPAGKIPDGFEIDKVTDNVGPDGERLQAWNKLRQERGPAEAPPPDFALRKITTATVGDREVMTWKSFEPERVARWEAVREAIAEAVRPFEGGGGCVGGPDPQHLQDTVSMYCLGDPHIGMLSWGEETGTDFDLKIADRITNEAVIRMCAAAPPSRVGALVLIGDNFHADTDMQVTPGHGHKLDVDTRKKKVWRTAKRMWRIQVDRMLEKHSEVRVFVISGNHDPETAFHLREWLDAWYRNEPRLIVEEAIREHQYFRFGNNLIGMTHGHLSTPDQLAMIMANDMPDDWAACKNGERHWLLGHEHKKAFGEAGGCTWERLRTLAPADAYAARHHWRSKRAGVVISYHPLHGEILRATVGVHQ